MQTYIICSDDKTCLTEITPGETVLSQHVAYLKQLGIDTPRCVQDLEEALQIGQSGDSIFIVNGDAWISGAEPYLDLLEAPMGAALLVTGSDSRQDVRKAYKSAKGEYLSWFDKELPSGSYNYTYLGHHTGMFTLTAWQADYVRKYISRYDEWQRILTDYANMLQLKWVKTQNASFVELLTDEDIFQAKALASVAVAPDCGA